ncbi:hypothetical protein PAMC26577_14065 [Caballeronia sordidicola]|uniref:Uncharacterized protein n=1 Tax=Caballeronia sordidicola TaxID=196367 RepID=A0A242MUI6_CABSO|nr:hypothetical protein PAMC26577_14065 [Caballeronia sordidicola]
MLVRCGPSHIFSKASAFDARASLSELKHRRCARNNGRVAYALRGATHLKLLPQRNT